MKGGIEINVSRHRVNNIPDSLYGAFVHIPCNRADVDEVVEEYIKTYELKKNNCIYIDVNHMLERLSEEQFKYMIPDLKDRIDQQSIYHRIWKYIGKDVVCSPSLGFIIIFSTCYTVTIELTEYFIVKYNHFKKCLDDCYKEYVDVDYILYSAIDIDSVFRKDNELLKRFDCPADRNFTESVSQLSDEIRERVKKLKILGVEECFIKALFEPEKTLSRLLVTKDYRIFLPDYGNIEIKMEPLPKAVYLLFLKYDSGIVFKELPFYHYDLHKIYVCVTKSYNLNIAENSLERVLDPTNNSINEKCSRIREAFVSQIEDSIAKNYYINGKRACPKRITLDRKLLVTEVDL